MNEMIKTLTPPLSAADVGRRFERRCGDTVTGDHYATRGEEKRRFWAGDYWYYDDGRWSEDEKSPIDLIRRLPEEPTLTREEVEDFVKSKGGTVTWPDPMIETRELLAKMFGATGWQRVAEHVRQGHYNASLPAIAKILNEWKEKQG